MILFGYMFLLLKGFVNVFRFLKGLLLSVMVLVFLLFIWYVRLVMGLVLNGFFYFIYYGWKRLKLYVMVVYVVLSFIIFVNGLVRVFVLLNVVVISKFLIRLMFIKEIGICFSFFFLWDEFIIEV